MRSCSGSCFFGILFRKRISLTIQIIRGMISWKVGRIRNGKVFFRKAASGGGMIGARKKMTTAKMDNTILKLNF